MAACYVLTHTITDLERYQREYIPGTGRILAKHQGTLLVEQRANSRCSRRTAACWFGGWAGADGIC